LDEKGRAVSPWKTPGEILVAAGVVLDENGRGFLPLITQGH
jgi:hypothetical protein